MRRLGDCSVEAADEVVTAFTVAEERLGGDVEEAVDNILLAADCVLARKQLTSCWNMARSPGSACTQDPDWRNPC